MTPERVHLIKTTWAQVKPISVQAAALFYGRLFALDPALRTLFKSDLKAQGEKLMRAISLVVNSLDKLDAIQPAIRSLGQRHVGYGVQAVHYDTVGAALLWTLEQGLGEAFTPEIKAAWAEAYNTLASVMKEAAEAAEVVA